MTSPPAFLSNFEYMKHGNLPLYNVFVECEEFYHSNNPKVPINLMRTACERLVRVICRHQKVDIPYIDKMTFYDVLSHNNFKSYLDESQFAIINIIRMLGNDVAHGEQKPRDLSYNNKKIIKEAATTIYAYEQSWKPSLSQTMIQIFFDLTKSLADVAGYPSITKKFEAPPDLLRILLSESNLNELEKKKLQDINADLEREHLDLARQIGIFKETKIKQKKLYELWDTSKLDRNNFLREINSFVESIDHDTAVIPRIKKWLEENPTDLLSATNEQHRIASEQWIKSDEEAKQVVKEQSEKIDELQTRITNLKTDGERYQNWVTEYPVKLPEELDQTLWQRRSEFFVQRLMDMQPPFEEYFGIPEKIGEGGWGTAYKCSPKQGIRYVAKIVKGDITDPGKIEDTKKVWQKEAQIATKLTLLDRRITGIAYPIRESDPDHLGFTMYEYIDGKPLSTYLNRNPVSLPKALLWSTLIASTVFDLRKKRIWFTDLGYNNIIIRDDMPVLIDPTPLQPGSSNWPPEWSSHDGDLDLFSNAKIPASGQLFQLAWLLISMICPQTSKKANYHCIESSACPIRGRTPRIDERELNENNKQTVRDCVNYAIEKLPQEHQRHIKDRKNGLVDFLISCIDIDPDRRKEYDIEDFKTLLLSFFDPFGVFQSTY